ncbi:MAG: hypothetical protein C0592_10550 [Marinilabiliales bacterium]|nr:MAG: hypothetical protein C0592_10550 [Marinilabiliales bacterium]
MSDHKNITNKLFAGKWALPLVFASGLILGGGSVYLILSLSGNYVKNTTAQNDVVVLDSVDLDEGNDVVYNPDTNIVFPDTIPDSVAYEQIWNSLIAEPGYREMDSLFLDSLVKRIYADSVMQIHRETYDIHLQNEELLSAKYFNVDVLTHIDDSTETYKTSSTDRYYIEFWKSPVNFEGYVRTGKSIKLYSVQPGESISLIIIESELYMLRKNQWFLLSETASEKSFAKVYDAGMLEILAEVK